MVDKTEEPKKEKEIGRLVLAGGGFVLDYMPAAPFIICSQFILTKKEPWGAASRDMSLINRFLRHAGW